MSKTTRYRSYAYRWAAEAVRYGINALYPPERARLRRWFSPLLERLHARIALLQAGVWRLVYLMGDVPERQKPVKVLFAAPDGANWETTLRYIWQELTHTGEYCTGEDCTCRADRLEPLVEQMSAGCDLVFVEISRARSWLPRRGEWVLSPVCVRMVFDFQPGESWEQIEKKFHAQRQNLKRIRRAGFTFCFTKDEDDLKHFYERMYLPFVRQRHDRSAFISNLQTAKNWLRSGDLMLLVDPSGKAVAGSLNAVRGRVKFLILNGVLDADPEIIRQGALSALYYFNIRWCFENGFSRCDFGGTWPFADDGSYLHKTWWGLRPVHDPWMATDWLFWVPNDLAWGLNWLRNKQFLPDFSRMSGPMKPEVAPSPVGTPSGEQVHSAG